MKDDEGDSRHTHTQAHRHGHRRGVVWCVGVMWVGGGDKRAL